VRLLRVRCVYEVRRQSKVPVPPAPTPTDASAVVAVLPGSEEVVCLTKEELLEVLQALGVAVDEETMADEDALREAARKGIVTKRQRFEARVTEDSVVTALQPVRRKGEVGSGGGGVWRWLGVIVGGWRW
jgi:hypothetical protein